MSTLTIKPVFSKSLLKSLIAAILFSSVLATSTAAVADSCSCEDDSVPTVSIDESNEAHPNQLTLTAKNAYYQLKDKKGQILQDRLYDVTPFTDGRMIAKRDGKYGLIDTQGQLIFDFSYDGIEILPAALYVIVKQQGASYSSALVRDANNWLYPASGKFVAKTSVEQLYYDETNSIGYYKTAENGKFGLINDKKQTLISNQYDALDLLDSCPNERLFMTVRIGDKTGLIDQNQQFVVPLKTNQTIENFNEDEQIFRVSRYVSDAYSDEAPVLSEKLVKGKGQTLIESDSLIENVAGNLYQYSYNQKYGVINHKAEVIAPATFDHISFDSASSLVVTKDDKQGILQKNADNEQLVVNRYYDRLQEAYMNDMTLAQLRVSGIEEQEGYAENNYAEESYLEESYAEENSYSENDIAKGTLSLDAAAEVLVEVEYTENDDYDFQDTLFIARDNNKYGLIDSADQIRIPFLYDDMRLSTDVLLVKKDQKYGLLTAHNETVAGVYHDDIELIYNTEDELVYRVTEGDQQGIINVKGEKLFPLSPYQVIDDSDNSMSKYIIRGSNGKYGLLDDNASSILIPAEYEKIERELANHYIIAQLDGKRVLIDNFGQVTAADFSQYTEIYQLNETDSLLVTSDNGKQGVVDFEGKIVIAAEYDSVTPILFGYYSDDDRAIYYKVERDSYYGLVDTSGKTIIKPKYTDIAPLYYFPYLIASDSQDNSDHSKVGLIDNKGTVLKSLKYDFIEESYYGEDEQIALIMISNNTVEIYDTKLKLIKKMSLEEYQRSD